jgi:hypothetical protein
MTLLPALTCEHIQLHLTDSSTKHKVVEGAAATIPCAPADMQTSISR